MRRCTRLGRNASDLIRCKACETVASRGKLARQRCSRVEDDAKLLRSDARDGLPLSSTARETHLAAKVQRPASVVQPALLAKARMAVVRVASSRSHPGTAPT